MPNVMDSMMFYNAAYTDSDFHEASSTTDSDFHEASSAADSGSEDADSESEDADSESEDVNDRSRHSGQSQLLSHRFEIYLVDAS